tara:strand:+ start:2223 stop:2402 length:180 start_codon:yes stop_codon:yes gene_type:complete
MAHMTRKLVIHCFSTRGCKATIPKLKLRDYNAQVSEALAGLKSMNKVIRMGMSVREQAA